MTPSRNQFSRCVLITLLFGSVFCFPFNVRAAVLINEIMYHPSSENVLEEYVELHNTGATNVSLANWRFSKGIQFTFPNVTLPAGGFLVVAANTNVFSAKYPGVNNVIGNWTGRLSNSRNDLDLDDAAGNRVDSVEYADEGDWAVRQRTPVDLLHRGWTWFAAHDGFGKSAELINPRLSNNHGQNWAPSLVTQGTPGAANSAAQTNLSPIILDVQHLPPIPRSIDPVLITARLLDERTNGLGATLHWRPGYTNLSFAAMAMFDDGLHDDGLAGDGVFAATLPPQTNNAVIEFYISATDGDLLQRTWPAAAIETNGASLGQAANLLFQVDDSAYTGTFPLYKLIMREADRAELAQIGSGPRPTEANSNAEMNGSFISVDATGTTVRYPVGIRNRGHGSRNLKPNSYRVAFSSDNRWKGVTAINLNGQYTHLQILGSVLSLQAGVGGANSRAVQVRVNNVNLGDNGPRTFGGMYAANEVINSEWAEHWFPADSSGNVYDAVRDISPPDFNWRGSNYLAYTNTWFKQSNTTENDWSDLIGMLRILGTNDLYSVNAARNVAHMDQWLTYFAVMALFSNRETSPNTGHNDDYVFYAGRNDPRFRMIYYDLDTILGGGGTIGLTNDSIFTATNQNQAAFRQFLMNTPEFHRTYHHTLHRLLLTTFSKSEFDATVDQTLGEFVPTATLDAIKDWMDGRRAYVQAFIAPYLAANPVPSTAVITGEPRSPTPLRSATLAVGGPGITHYRFRLNNGSFGATNAVAVPLTLTNLAHNSTNTVFVVGLSTNGAWQSASNPTPSATWVVNTNVPSVRINEVLAQNVAASNHAGTFPDMIELFNEGAASVNLSGLRLSDRLASPNKYTFPNGATLAAGAHMVLFANNSDGTPGIHLGFSLDQDGEGVFLFDRVTNGGALLDSVEFGPQLPDRSVGRIANAGQFTLTVPTFGSANVAQALGNPQALRINEWLASEFVSSPTDFIELYNPEPLPVAMGGLWFTDNPIGDPAKHRIAPLSFIAAQSYHVFKADGDTEQGLDHLNFTLPAEQGLIALLNPAFELIDCVLYGPQTTDVSQGRVPAGGNAIASLSNPSPGSANSVVSTACTVITTNVLVLPLTGVWLYNQTNNLDAVNWKTNAYSDLGWATGMGALAFETNEPFMTPLIHTTLADPRTAPPGLTPGRGYYFRATIELDAAPSAVTANVYVDDGAVIYVNGIEAARLRMGSGTITNRSLAINTPPGGDVTNAETVVLSPSLFEAGFNLIAVEVHQNQTNSSDIVWGMALAMQFPVTNCGPTGVIFNEVFASNESFTNGAGRTPDWVELYNAGTNTVNLADMSLTDDSTVPRKWIFPTNTSLAAGARMVIELDNGAASSSTNAGFGLDAGGDAVYLFNQPASGGGMIDSVIFGVQPADFSVGRLPDASSAWGLTLPTRGTVNVGAGLGNGSLLRINEWMASPAEGDDWLELYNPNSQPVELTSLALTDDPSDRDRSPFPPLSFIGPAACLKLIADNNSGNGANHVSFSLNGEGDFLGLYWPIGTQIDALSFAAQTEGVSQGRFPDASTAMISFLNTASPGAPNYLLLTNLVINEVLSHTDPPLEDAVEIRNVSSNAVDISGWYLSNSGQNLLKFLVPSNTIVPAGGYAVLYEYQFGAGTSPGALAPFNFNSAHGDQAHLSQAVAGELSGYRARAEFGAAANGVSFGRFVTSVGEEFVAMSSRSFGMDAPSTPAQFRTGAGQANPYPLVGPVIISEIHFHPANAYLGDTNAAEFLELANRSGATQLLYDPAAVSNTWRLEGGIDFTLPAGISLGGGETLLLVSFDPGDATKLDWFRGTYQVPTNVMVLGPWSGTLANEGEELRLLRPDPPQLPPGPDAGFVPYLLVEHVRYSPAEPWATNGIGAGASLHRAPLQHFGNEPVNWFADVPSPGFHSATDSDGDGLPNYWELANGLDPNNSAGTNGADADPDGDGPSNRLEFLAGTDPNNGNDHLRIDSVEIGGGLATIRFHAMGGRSYSVLYTDDLSLGPWSKLADAPVSANPAWLELLDSSLSASNRFYRLVAPATP